MSQAADELAASIETNLLITVSGPPGCGATTLCDKLSEAIDCPYISGGDIFREVAEKHDLTLTQLTAKAQESDEFDRALDERIRDIAKQWGDSEKPCIIESRLAGWLAGNHADLRIRLDAPTEIRKERVSGREETVAEMQVREVSEAQRYDSYYEIDVEDREMYDIQLNTARWSKRGVFEIVRAAIEQYDETEDEGAFETPEIPI
jgi:cytidylate kinase